MELSHEMLGKLAEKYSIYWCDEYGEPGYSSRKDKGILFSNWNDVPTHVSSWLERKGYELEWFDEWYIDHNRSRCYRTSPDSYHWKPSVLFWDCEPITIDDVEEGPTDYLEHLENDSSKCDTFNLDLSSLGYECIDDSFENGWHPEQTDDPQKILAALLKREPDGVFIFQLKENSQFYSRFSVWRKLPEENEE